jgi:geranylgeranyl reductase family protein
MEKTDVCIIGAGPAGATLSHFLHKEGIDHAVVDKAAFPRDKVCGDGITIDVLNVLGRISPSLRDQFTAEHAMMPSWGFSFQAPGGHELRYDFKADGLPVAPFYTSKRLHLDDFLLRTLPEGGSGRFYGGTTVRHLERSAEGFRLGLEGGRGPKELAARIVIGAEGEKPVVSRHLGTEKPYRKKQHLIGALRVYYEGVQGFNPNGHLEFIFDKRLLPGYFWAFPLPDGTANVGLGMVSTAASQRKINLKKILPEILESNPRVREMFAQARPLEKPRGWGLPTMTAQRPIAGEGYALIGDAAGMIEPFTGKGIGTGMMSARICSEHIRAALHTGQMNFAPYQQHMYRYYHSEMRAGYLLQKTLRYPPVLNAVLGLSNTGILKRWSHAKMLGEWRRWV